MEVPVTRGFEVATIRAEFPCFARRVNGEPLAYLDSASTSQKPRAVIDAVARAMTESANIHRGVHALSVETTAAFEGVRAKAARFVGATDPREIVFVRGTTEALNLVAQSWGRANVHAGDEIVVTELEHHSNIVPWQLLCRERGAKLVVIPIEEDGAIDLAKLDARISEKTKLVSIAHVSNTLGAVLPVAEIARRAKARGALVAIDGAQAAPHVAIDVRAIDCDFYAFSAHKAYGPTGAGVLWGRRALLDAMPPWQGGGDMIAHVSWRETTYAETPHKLEAGTPDIAAVIGMGAAIDWLSAIDRDALRAHEHGLLDRMCKGLRAMPFVRVFGAGPERAGVVSFTVDGVHAHDVGTALDLEGVAVRTGHHCTEPLLEKLGVDATVRASVGAYTTTDDVDRMLGAVARAKEALG